MTMRFGANSGFRGFSVASPQNPKNALYFGANGGFKGGRTGDLFIGKTGGASGFRVRSKNGDALFFGRNGGVSGYSVGNLYFDRNGRSTGWKI